jgi:enoyl-CoA hydratase/carnithine racemase
MADSREMSGFASHGNRLKAVASGCARLAQCEALMGIVPGGGGTQYLANRLGRNCALEAVLGADLFDAETAERTQPIADEKPTHRYLSWYRCGGK